MNGARTTIALVLLGLLALGVRVWVVLAPGGAQDMPRETPASRIAQTLLAGHGFSAEQKRGQNYFPCPSDIAPPTTPTESSSDPFFAPTSAEAPFYPLLLAAAYRCFGTVSPAAVLAVQLLQCVAGAVLVLVVAWLGWSLLPDRPGFGWLAAAAATFYPPHLVLVAHLQVAVWAALALSLLLAVAVSTQWHTARWRAILAGLLAGLLLLMEPMLVLALPVCAVAFWLSDGESTWEARLGGARIGRVALMLGVAVLVIAPWLVRNRVVHGRFTFVTTDFGHALWEGNNSISGEADRDPVPPGDHAEFSGLSEPQRSQLLLRRACQGIWEHPTRYGQLCLTRLYHFLLLDDTPGSRPERIATVAWLVLGMLGWWLSRGRWRSLWPTYAIFAVSAFFPVLVSVSARFRTAIEPMTLVWASAAVAPVLVRLLPQHTVKVYRPGEQAHDMPGTQHVLKGPHYDLDDVEVARRRRAG